MSTGKHIIVYIRPLARLSEATQMHLAKSIQSHDILVEGRRRSALVEGLDLLIEIVSPRDVVALHSLIVLANPRDPKRRRHSLEAAREAIEDKGCTIWELSTGLRSDRRKSRDRMFSAALDDIARANRGETGGRPASEYSDDQMDVMRRHWFDMRHRTNDDAVAAIQAEARKRKLPKLGNITKQIIGKKTLLGPSGRARLKRQD